MLVTCSGCGSSLQVPDSALGKRVQCSNCNQIIAVPDAVPGPSDAISCVPGVAPPPPPSAGTDVTANAPPPSNPAGPRGDDFDGPRRDMDDQDLNVRRRDAGEGAATGTAIASMVLGLIGIASTTLGCLICGAFGGLLGLILGILALVFGKMQTPPEGATFAMVGRVTGIISIVLGVLAIIIGIAMIVFLFTAGQAGGGRKF